MPHLSSPNGNIGSVQNDGKATGKPAKPAHNTTVAKNVAARGPLQPIRQSCPSPARVSTYLCNPLCKYTSSLNGHNQPIKFRAKDSKRVDYECELAFVVGRRARNVTRAKALKYVFGYP